MAVGNYTAVDDAGCGLVLQRLTQQGYAVVGRCEMLDQFAQKRRGLTPIELVADRGEEAQAFAQAGELARAGALQRDARGDALDVGEAAQHLVDIARRVEQARER